MIELRHACLPLAVLVCTCAAAQGDFDAQIAETEVTTQQVGDGLHVLFGVGGAIAASIGEQGVLIVDDQFPGMIPKIRAAIRELGGGDIDFAINTHWHFDHADGNLVLGPEGTWIVSQENSREQLTRVSAASPPRELALKYLLHAAAARCFPARKRLRASALANGPIRTPISCAQEVRRTLLGRSRNSGCRGLRAGRDRRDCGRRK